jgi:hypothetical protein
LWGKKGGIWGLILTRISWLGNIGKDDFPNAHPLINILVILRRPLFEYLSNILPLLWYDAHSLRSLKRHIAFACAIISVTQRFIGIVKRFEAVIAVKDSMTFEVLLTESFSKCLDDQKLEV